MKYEIGDFVSKPVTGICKIEDVLSMDPMGGKNTKLYYLMKPVEDEKEKIYVAVSNVDEKMRSCLTEEDHFLGNTDYFKEIRNISPLPMIRKDFIIDPYQIYEAKVIGADCILLIAAILSDEQMAEYYKLATELGMDVLVETHDEEEMGRALKIQPKIIGVNNRNLKDFTISLENTKRLRPMVPEGTVFVSESGVTTNEHIAFLKECKVDALLIGGAFMLSEHPRELATEWKNLYNEK